MKIRVIIFTISIIFNSLTQAVALSVRNRVYVVFGSGSSAEVESERIVTVGDNNS